MKLFIPLSIILLFAINVGAQTNTFPTNGNVGIGIVPPDSKLHVIGDIHHNGTAGGNGSYSNVLKIQPLDSSPAYFYINTNIRANDSFAPQIQVTGYMYTSTNKAMKMTLGWYHYQNNFYWSQYQSDIGYQKPSRVRLGKYTKGDGNVYVRIEISNNSVYWANYTVSATDIFDNIAAYSGWTYEEGEMPTSTTSEIIEVPQQQYVDKLDVNGDVKWSGNNSGNPRALKIGYSGNNYGGLGYNVDFTSTTGLFNRPIADRSSYLEFTNGGFKFFGNSNSNNATGINANGGGDNLNLFATITNTGNVGIGTTAPNENLSIAGISSSGSISLAPGTTTYAAYKLLLTTQASDEGFNMSMGGTKIMSTYGYYDADEVGFGNLGHQNLLYLNVGGNVGIGTTTPTEKLTVNGKIKAKEIRVLPGDWSDFVFADDYKLSSLTEIEQYIKQHKHLPDIPSAKEVAKDGIELGEMNKLLLKKVEELTLLLIQKDKEMIKEKKINIDQNRMIEELAKRVDLITKK